MTESDNPGNDRTVLLVGATPRDSRIVTCGLEREGISVVVAADVRTAINRLTVASENRTTVDLPDLLAVDLTTTPEEGLTVLGAIRASPCLCTLPAVAIVEEALPAAELRTRIQRAYNRGVNGCISKPDNPEAYADTLQQMAEFWFSRVSLPPESLYSASTSV